MVPQAGRPGEGFYSIARNADTRRSGGTARIALQVEAIFDGAALLEDIPSAMPAAKPIVKLSSPATQEFWEVEVLYEDEHLLALNKPALLLSSPDRYDPQRPNLMKLLHADISRGAAWVKARAGL